MQKVEVTQATPQELVEAGQLAIGFGLPYGAAEQVVIARCGDAVVATAQVRKLDASDAFDDAFGATWDISEPDVDGQHALGMTRVALAHAGDWLSLARHGVTLADERGVAWVVMILPIEAEPHVLSIAGTLDGGRIWFLARELGTVAIIAVSEESLAAITRLEARRGPS